MCPTYRGAEGSMSVRHRFLLWDRGTNPLSLGVMHQDRLLAHSQQCMGQSHLPARAHNNKHKSDTRITNESS